MRTVVGVGVAGAPGVDVVAGLDLRPLHPVRQQTHVVSSRPSLPARRTLQPAAAPSFFFFFCKSGHRASETSEPALCCHSLTWTEVDEAALLGAGRRGQIVSGEV